MNIQNKLKTLFDGACLALCYAYYVLRESDPKQLVPYVIEGWQKGYIEDDGYVAHPLEYLNMRKNLYKDVTKEPYTKPYDPVIVRWENGKYSHFVVMDGYGILFDPMGGESNTVKKGTPADMRVITTN